MSFGLAVNFTGEASLAASVVEGLALAALGLRISRLLRFCDLAMMVSLFLRLLDGKTGGGRSRWETLLGAG